MDVVLYARIRMEAKVVSDWKARCMELVEVQAEIERAMSGYGSLRFERTDFEVRGILAGAPAVKSADTQTRNTAGNMD